MAAGYQLTGGTSIALWDMGGLVIDIRSAPYKAVADGVTDNTARIQSAINDIYALGGGTVFIAPSTLGFCFTNLVLKTGVTLTGAGYASYLKGIGTNSRAVENLNRTGPSITDENITISNLRITNNGGPNTSEFAHDVDLRYVRGVRYDNLWLEDASGDGIYNRGNENVEIRHITIGDVARQGISVTSGVNYRIGHITGVNCNAGNLVDIEPNPGDTISTIDIGMVEVLSGTANALNIYGDDPDTIFDLTVANVKTRTLTIRGTTRFSVGKITTTPTSLTDPGITLFHANQGTIDRIDSLGSAIDMQKLAISTCDDVTIKGAKLVGPGGSANVALDVVTCNRLTLCNINITAAGLYGLRVRNSNDVIVDGYVVDAPSAYGLVIDSTTANGDILVRGLRTTNCGTASVRLQGTANVVRINGDISSTTNSSTVSISATFVGQFEGALLGYSGMAYPGSASPTRGVFFRGDRVYQRQPTAGNPKGWLCTASGGATSTTRADLTAYAIGVSAIWSTGVTVWEVTTAGTTAGAAPSIVGKVVGDTVVDGTVTWTMRSLTTTVFVSEGNL